MPQLKEEPLLEKKSNIFDRLTDMGHEQIVFSHDAKTGLKALIGIHNTVLGPALGGLRMWPYESEDAAVQDVLRLSRGMTFKNSIAGLNLGGGKAVIIGNARTDKSEAKLRSFGKFVHNLNGKYITAEDVGMTSADIEKIFTETPHVSGKPESRGGLGDPSPITAYSTYIGMKAAAKKAFGSDSLQGRTVGVQGAGNVGEYLIEYLLKENCKVFVSEYYEPRLKEITSKHRVTAVELDEIYDIDMDIYAPCALGATVNDQTLSRLKCKVIAGCANNQLANEAVHGQACVDRGIVYAPDFLINAGGVTNCYAEVIGTSKEWTWQHVETFYEKTLEVLDISEKEKRNAQAVAIEVAMERIDSIAQIKASY